IVAGFLIAGDEFSAAFLGHQPCPPVPASAIKPDSTSTACASATDDEVLGGTTTSGWIPTPSNDRPDGVRYDPTVNSIADPSESSFGSCTEPLPNVCEPTTTPRLRSCSAPVTTSAAEAVPPSTRIASGVPVSPPGPACSFNGGAPRRSNVT